MEVIADEELMSKVAAGCANSLGILFDRYSRLVFAVARNILRDHAEAEDVTQEVFLEFYRKARLYDPVKGSVKVWLLQYAYHRSFNRRKYLNLRGFYVNPANGSGYELNVTRTESDFVADKHWQKMLQEGLDKLNERERQIIGLVVVEGCSLREASGRLRLSYAASRSTYYRAIKKLRDCLSTPNNAQHRDRIIWN